MVPNNCLVDEIFFPLDPFHANGFFIYPLKTSKNHWFSDVFRMYRKRPVA